jgi:signal transduction histidine kinase
LDCDEDIPGEWDEARMSQVLSNLLGNAVQHGARRSPVTLTAYLGDTGVELAVHNDGPAIPPHLVPKLFDCMFQGTPMPKNASDASTSLGLGLYIAKEIITAQGGTIDVYSTDAEGTTFIARLPHPTPPAVGNGNTIGAAPAGNV